MKKTVFTLKEILNLKIELTGVQINGETVVKGILDESLDLSTRYHLNKILKVCEKENESFEAVRVSLIKEHGVTNEDGSMTIPEFIDNEKGEKIPNPILNTVSEQVNNLLNQKVTLKHEILKIEDFSKISTNVRFEVFFKLFD